MSAQGSTSARRPMGVPRVYVSDLHGTLAYYRDVYGFIDSGIRTGTGAIVTGHGVRLLLTELQERSDGAPPPGEGGEPDAVLFVKTPVRLRRELDARGADVLPTAPLGPEWPGAFGVSDPDGNVLAFAATGGPLAPLRQRWSGPADRLTRAMSERKRAREEAVHLEELRAFYASLNSHQDIVYLFFSEKLLHWVTKAMSYVPPEVNLVLLGSDLPEEEIRWIQANAARPFHNVRLRIDDRIAWEFLFEVNQFNFGWLDSDCFVLEPDLFREIADIAPSTSLNCCWAWDSGFGWPLANTFFLFVNVQAIAAVRAQGAEPNPCSHDYDWHSLLVPGRRCYSRTPTRSQLRLLRRLLPTDGRGRAPTPHGMSYYDTTVMYQLLARACGYDIHQVRDLEGFGHLRGRRNQDESSDELLHVGGGSRADALSESTGYFHNTETRLLYLIAESVMLEDALAQALPEYYAQRRARVLETLAAHGLSPAAAKRAIWRHLVEDRGMSSRGAGAVLRAPLVSS